MRSVAAEHDGFCRQAGHWIVRERRGKIEKEWARYLATLRLLFARLLEANNASILRHAVSQLCRSSLGSLLTVSSERTPARLTT